MLPDWMLRAKCHVERIDPRKFDSDDPTPAQLLCAGCLVQKQCKQWHEQPINVSDYVERFTGVKDEPDIVMPSGVKAAGKLIE